MRKTILVVFLVLLASLPLSAADTGLGLSFGATSPLMEVGGEVEGQYSDMLGLGGEVMVDFAYMPSTWFSVGASAGVSVFETPHSDGVLWRIPAYVDVTLAPGGRVRFPMTISGGGYLEMTGDSLGYGPAARVSLGVESDLGGWTVYAKTQAEALFHISDEGVRTFIALTPIIFGARMVF